MGGRRHAWWGRWRAWPVLVRDGLLAALLAGLTFVPAMAGSGIGLVVPPAREVDAAVVVLALGQCLPLVLRRRAPALCLLPVAVCFALFQLHGSNAVASGMGLVVALYSAGAYQRRGRVALAVAATALYLVMVVGLHASGPAESLEQEVTFYLLLAACWLVGQWVRAQRREEVAHRHLERAAAAAAERARIARELHDVVTHHVTAMVIQADAATYLTDRPERLGTALGDIADTGRQALVELRHQLGVLQPAAAGADAGGRGAVRAPVLEPLEDLVARAEASGQPVRLVRHGRSQDLPEVVALAVHRVVQESLTNALKHAPSCRTTVTVERTGTAVDVEVVTAGRPTGSPAALRVGGAPQLGAAGSGRGLTGLADRVEVLGGRFDAGPRPAGGFAVRARIPVPVA